MLQITNRWQYWHARNPDVFHLLSSCENNSPPLLFMTLKPSVCLPMHFRQHVLTEPLTAGLANRNEYRLIMWWLHCQNCKDGKLWFMPRRRKWRILEQPRSFTWQKLMNWLREISRSFKEKLLSSLGFYKIIFLIIFNTGKLCKYDLFACWQQRLKFKDLKFASNCYKNEGEASLHKTKTGEKTWIHHYDAGKSNDSWNIIIKIYLQKENENSGFNRKIHFAGYGKQVISFT